MCVRIIFVVVTIAIVMTLLLMPHTPTAVTAAYAHMPQDTPTHPAISAAQPTAAEYVKPTDFSATGLSAVKLMSEDATNEGLVAGLVEQV